MSPYITGFFLVFAGMLVGYLLWNRDRREERTNQIELGQENNDLRISLRLAHASHQKLDEKYIRQTGQLNVLQKLCDEWSSNREDMQQEHTQLSADAADKILEIDEVLTKLQQERSRRLELEDQNHRLAQEQLDIKRQIEEEWRSKHSKLESSFALRENDFSRLVNENERLTQTLHQSRARVAELHLESTNQRSLLETVTTDVDGLKQEYVTAESALQTNAELLKQSNADCAAARSAQLIAEESLAAIREDYQTAQSQIQSLQDQLSEIASLESQVSSLSLTLKNNADQLKNVSLQRDEAREAEKSALKRATGLQHRISNQEMTIHAIREKRDSVLNDLQIELQNRSEIELAFEHKTQELESRLDTTTTQFQTAATDLQSKADEASSRLEAERNEWQSRINDHACELAETTNQRNRLSAELSETQQKLAKTQHELHASLEQSELLATEVGRLQEICQRISELEKLVKQRDAEEELISEELYQLRNQQEDSNKKQQELLLQLETELQERQQLTGNLGQLSEQIQVLQNKLSASEGTIRTLRRERAGVLARLANYRTVSEPDATVISFTEAMAQRAKQATTYDEEYGGPTSHHETRGLVYNKPPASRDDLKRISGIAEVLEGRLNDYGIYTFKQIMEWSPTAVEEFSRILAFRDRIERDDWLGQAAFFYNKKKKTTRRIAA